MSDINRCLGCMAEKTEQPQCPHCGWQHDGKEVSLMHIPPGTILTEKYLIGRPLGQGGFGITYLAYDLNLKIKLAIKEFFPQGLISRVTGTSEITVYSSELKDQYEFGLDKFLNEAQILARFEEPPGIVTVRDFFRANGTAYMVMSYIEGITLEEYLKQQGGKISFNNVLNIMMPVMDALNEVHGSGIMHRDISPDNVVIDGKGRVVLIDFGAARQDMREKSRSLSVVLKPGYAPEEQYRSRGKQGAWTDIYALGATMYRAITGKIPLESLDRFAGDELIAPSVLGVQMPQKAESVLLKAMSVWSKDRYQNVQEFQEAMYEFFNAKSLSIVSNAANVTAQKMTYPETENVTLKNGKTKHDEILKKELARKGKFIDDKSTNVKEVHNSIELKNPANAKEKTQEKLSVPLKKERTSVYAIVSFVISIVLFLGIIVGPLLAIYFGVEAKNEISKGKGMVEGDGLATAGIIIGGSGFFVNAFFIVYYILDILFFGDISIFHPLFITVIVISFAIIAIIVFLLFDLKD